MDVIKVLELFSGKKVWIGSKGYPMIWVDKKNKMLHEYVWEEKYGLKPKGFEIHHKDENKLNYDISNLTLVSNSEHHKIHSKWVKNDDGEWIAKPCNKCHRILSLDEFYQRKGYTPSALCKSCHIKATNSYAKNNEKTKEYKKQWYQKNKK